jgi:two-component system, chemotaxis family, response regulator Rcp1
MEASMQADTVGRAMEILLVEDSVPQARLTMGALKRGGIAHHMTWLSDGEEAVEFLHRRGKYTRVPHPDLVLLDLILPGISGQEVLKVIRGEAELRRIPVVVMTAADEATANPSSLDVEGFLRKPINLDEFLTIVDRLKEYWKVDMILPQRDG